jgi:hypothetical protein
VRSLGLRTSAALVLRTERHNDRRPFVEPPLFADAAAEKLLVQKGINPNRMRKGKSGELTRRVR